MNTTFLHLSLLMYSAIAARLRPASLEGGIEGSKDSVEAS
jgi:hypothetical protein